MDRTALACSRPVCFRRDSGTLQADRCSSAGSDSCAPIQACQSLSWSYGFGHKCVGAQGAIAGDSAAKILAARAFWAQKCTTTFGGKVPRFFCQARGVHAAQSNHNYVRFNLPACPPQARVEIKSGARHRYVFPACHRVLWDDITYECQGDRKGSRWVKIKGNARADGLCTNWGEGWGSLVTVGNR